MSFEVFLECFGKTANLGLPRVMIRSLFTVDEASSTPDLWRVHYDKANSCHIGATFLTNACTKRTHQYLERPRGDPRPSNSMTILKQS
jgi:hypothetical protein